VKNSTKETLATKQVSLLQDRRHTAGLTCREKAEVRVAELQGGY